ncbi:ABC transporter substrate-binding protein [Arthrobacter zhaoguopingii]|uniref:ABC transporter substrate-binding protein n=1 Tax=Arthrobacter zhaoguopingii TaxID=2681491 RepID=UPI001359E47F|nr:extracellular solute-binding protein [Arthrobacter zhaoguopingii]
MKRLAALRIPAVTAAFAFAVTGCTGTSSAAENDSGNGEQIRYLIEQPEDPAAVDLINEDIAVFEKQNPDIDVELEVLPTDNMRTVLQTQLRSGEGPDIFSWGSGPGYAGALADAGLLHDLTDAYEEHDWPVYEFAKEGVTFDGKVYGVPGDIETIGLFYNKQVFEDLGISEPTNLGELEAAAAAIAKEGLTPIAASDKEGWQGGHLLSMALSSRVGADGVDKLLNGEMPWTSPEVVAALDTWKSFNAAGYLPDYPTSLTYDGANALFYSGEAAILPTGSWATDEIAKNTDFEVGFIPFPAEDGPGIFSGGLGSGPYISASSKNTEAAEKFLDYLVSPEHGRWTVENFNTIPPFPVDTEGIDADPLFAQVIEDASKISDGTGEFGSNVDVLSTDVFNDAMWKGVQAMLTNQKSAEDVAADLDAAFQQ